MKLLDTSKLKIQSHVESHVAITHSFLFYFWLIVVLNTYWQRFTATKHPEVILNEWQKPMVMWKRKTLCKKKKWKKAILYNIHLPQIFYDLWYWYYDLRYWYLILWFYDIHSKYVVKNSREMSKVQIYSIHKTVLETYYYFVKIASTGHFTIPWGS